MTNQPDGNEILVYSRDETSGRLEYVSAVSSNGIGHGFQDGATDAALDPLDGQGSLAVSGNCLLAVNAGSHTITSFRIKSATEISIADTISSGGTFPVSIAAREGIVYVLNTGGVGSIAGFNLLPFNCKLTSLGASIDLSQTFPSGPPSEPVFNLGPKQIGFTPENNILVLLGSDGGEISTFFQTGNYADGTLNVYELDENGLTSAAALTKTVVPSSSLPYAFDFDSQGRLLLVEAVGAFSNGVSEPISLAQASSVNELGSSVSLWNGIDSRAPRQKSEVNTTLPTGCWVKYSPRDSCVYVTHPEAGSVSSLKVKNKRLKLVEAGAAVTGTPLFDLEFSPDYKFLYVLSVPGDSANAIYVYKVSCDCGLKQIQVITDGLPSNPALSGVRNEFNQTTGYVGMAVF